MKLNQIFTLISITLGVSSANAIHMYRGYTCKAGNITLAYDGPGSNYASTGLSNFYKKGSEAGVLAYNHDSSAANEDETAVTFSFTGGHVIGSVVSKKADPKKCEGYDFDEDKWHSQLTVRIDKITPAAARTLGLKVGTVLVMKCLESESTPVKCDN